MAMKVLNQRTYKYRDLPSVAHLDSLARQPERDGFNVAHYAKVRAERIRREAERVGGPTPGPDEPVTDWQHFAAIGACVGCGVVLLVLYVLKPLVETLVAR
jgi:hypothetical protein